MMTLKDATNSRLASRKLPNSELHLIEITGIETNAFSIDSPRALARSSNAQLVPLARYLTTEEKCVCYSRALVNYILDHRRYQPSLGLPARTLRVFPLIR